MSQIFSTAGEFDALERDTAFALLAYDLMA
jgi:hypothetical protein